jgi:hypothetical protein
MRAGRSVLAFSIFGIVLITAFLMVFPGIGYAQDNAPFGGKDDVAFGQKLWTAMDGYMSNWPIHTDYYPGRSPHGKFLKTYYSMVDIDGKPYHAIVKNNYGGADITMDKLSKSPDQYLVAITVMVQREAGYDPDNDNWYWIKYDKDGSISKNEKGVALAGRVAKGMDSGCIACHASAKGNDYFFSNDR